MLQSPFKTLLIGTTASLALSLTVTPAFADGTAPCNEGSTNFGVECDVNSDAGVNVTAVGANTEATAQFSSAFGCYAQASAYEATAVGEYSDAIEIDAQRLDLVLTQLANKRRRLAVPLTLRQLMQQLLGGRANASAYSALSAGLIVT